MALLDWQSKQKESKITLSEHHLQEIRVAENGVERAFMFRTVSEGDRGVVDQIFYSREYDLRHFQHGHAISQFYRGVLNRKRIPFVIDAGANIGASTVFFAMEFPRCRVVAIEPEPNNCILLRQNCNALNYELVEGGVAVEEGTAFLVDPGRGDWGFMLSTQGDHPVRMHSITKIIDEQIEHGGTPFIVKIDIEGGEADLFRVSTNWLAVVPVLIIELHDWILPGRAISRNFLRAISEHDFDLVTRGENVFCFNNKVFGDGDCEPVYLY
jgi:FkbM family methyltransferase